MPTLSKCQLCLSSLLFSVHHQCGRRYPCVSSFLWTFHLEDAEGTPMSTPFRVPMIGSRALPFLWVCLEGRPFWLWLLAPGLSSPPPGHLSQGWARPRSLNLVLVKARTAACSIQLKPRGEIYCWDADVPWTLEGRKCSWLGTRMGKSGAKLCELSLWGCWCVLLACLHRPAFICSVCTHKEGGCPSPVLKRSSVWMSASRTGSPCPNHKCLEEKQIGPASSDAHLCPCTEEAELGLEWACATSLMGTGRSLPNVPYLQSSS